jgi:hypothetical protein
VPIGRMIKMEFKWNNFWGNGWFEPIAIRYDWEFYYPKDYIKMFDFIIFNVGFTIHWGKADDSKIKKLLED